VQHKPDTTTKRKLLLLGIFWLILTAIIGLISYLYYPSWLAAAPSPPNSQNRSSPSSLSTGSAYAYVYSYTLHL
jgi:hypothetical protein